MLKTFILSNGNLNSYGFRVLTEGIELPKSMRLTMLWNHVRGDSGKKDDVLPIGKWVNLRIENGNLVADAEFDMDDPFAAEIARKVEKEFVFEASAGLKPIAWSSQKNLMLEGQTLPTLAKSRIREASIATIASNDGAVSLYDDNDALIDLNDTNALVQLTSKGKSTPAIMEELKFVALALGLSDNADQAKVLAEIQTLKAKAGQVPVLETQIAAFKADQAEVRKVEVKNLLDAAVTEGRLMQAQRPAYEKLFDSDFDSAKEVLAGLTKVVKLSDFPAGAAPGAAGKFTYDGKTFSQLSKENPTVLASLKENDLETFKQLYKAEFGKDYKVTEH
jgi:hypothetical protein